MNARQLRTLKAVFQQPTPAGLEWTAVEALLVAVGCTMVEGNGSRVRFVREGMIETFHRPHSAMEAKRYQVRAARDYLLRLGIEP